MRWDFARAALLGALVSLPVSLALVAMPLSSTADASATGMLLLTNQFRYAVGSPTVPADPRLTQAAQSHANHNSANGILGHCEPAGRHLRAVRLPDHGRLLSRTERPVPRRRALRAERGPSSVLRRAATVRVRLPGHRPAGPARDEHDLPRALRHHGRGHVAHQ